MNAEPDPSSTTTWWLTIESDAFLDALKEVANGRTPDEVLMRIYLESSPDDEPN